MTIGFFLWKSLSESPVSSVWIGRLFLSFLFLKTTVCTGGAESSRVFTAATAVGPASPAVPGPEDEVGGLPFHPSERACVCVRERETGKKVNSI